MGSGWLAQPEESGWGRGRGEALLGTDWNPFQWLVGGKGKGKLLDSSGKPSSLIDLELILSSSFRLLLSAEQGTLSCCHFASAGLFIGDDIDRLLLSKNFPPGRKPETQIKDHVKFHSYPMSGLHTCRMQQTTGIMSRCFPQLLIIWVNLHILFERFDDKVFNLKCMKCSSKWSKFCWIERVNFNRLKSICTISW